MAFLFIYCLMCYGLSAALVYYNGPGDILSKFRLSVSDNKYLSELFSCMFCLPTNIGFVLSLLSLIFAQNTPFTPFTVLMGDHASLWPLIILFDGFFTGAVVSIIDSMVDCLSCSNAETPQILND